MDQQSLLTELQSLPLGAIRFLSQVSSTNDEAFRWITEGAPDLALVVADEQTAGRGRGSRRWFTPPGASLAFSLILYPQSAGLHILPRMTALGAVATREALEKKYTLHAQIKWPNDLILERRKVGGVLAEAHWDGDQLKGLILGVGINVAPESVMHSSALRFPAICLEELTGSKVNRLELLRAILEQLLKWQPRLASAEFLRAWEGSLAFRGEWIQLSPGESFGKDGLPQSLEKLPQPIEEGQIIGLAPDGSLKLRTRSGEIITARVGEIRLKPAETIPGA
jgi:BirA family biotin operon repressor/biotin-[acetyl-CoA-carboxylase] ligase